jgi:glutamate-5-semialdehyde dehydrogenase
MDIKTLAREARDASITLAALSGEVKNKALSAVAEALLANKETVFKANQEDLTRSEKEGLAAPLMKRLKFDDKKLATVVSGIRDLIAMDDPVGVTQRATELDTGLNLYRVSCPIGVIGVIFESRPDALVQISSLCLKSGNAVLLKGGSEARETNRALYTLIKAASEAAGAPAGWIQLLETRQDVAEMLGLDAYIDLIIPRGSNAFVRHIMDNSNIPVMGHADGICHVYVDRGADIDMAVDIAVDAKTQYVAVCNALETLLVHKRIAQDYLPRMKAAMDDKGVKLVGCEKTRAIIDIPAAAEADWDTEYLELKLSVKVVDDLDAAIAHINRHGSGHTDSIVTPDEDAARRFLSLVDAANVFWNCSTRFSDGYVFGLGAEVGIATGKLHARGPVGMEGLLIYKYKLLGSGQTIHPYSAGEKHYTHKKIDGDCPL